MYLRKAIATGLFVLTLAGISKCLLLPRWMPTLAVLPQVERSDIEKVFRGIFDGRVACLVWGNPEELQQFYDASVASGSWALEHETGRVRCFQEWVRKRSVEISSVESTVRVVDFGMSKERLWGSVCHNLVLTYTHEPGEKPNVMGLRTIHWMELVPKGDRWLVRKDWFWDPLSSSLNPQIPVAELSDKSGDQGRDLGPARAQAMAKGSFNRVAAVRYADRYCGVTVGESDGRYNPQYRDFTYVGGDCTNFVSQVLADKNAGGLAMDAAWNYRNGSGTEAWLCAESFVRYMIQSGRGTLLKRGKYAEVAKFVEQLVPGDVVAFEENGAVKHVMVVTGKNQHGHVVVNSHSADRYHVPWDMGFEADAVYWLIRING
ncbi:MAG TPA: amidase domain-containing protein [Firmicutes bacterium]|nr:amidase domain-containing protein [Bacillota bacterium]